VTELMRSFVVTFLILAAMTLPGGAYDVRELPVARITIYPGDVIGREMLTFKSYRVEPNSRLTVFARGEDLAGKVARRTLLPGQLIPLNAVKNPDIVKQGRPVPIVYEAEGLLISSIGVALQSGAPGDFISVQNPDSGTTIKGVIGEDGSVRVGP
jgi:flagellar basal body P-ring formation protein FlgA